MVVYKQPALSPESGSTSAEGCQMGPVRGSRLVGPLHILPCPLIGLLAGTHVTPVSVDCQHAYFLIPLLFNVGLRESAQWRAAHERY